ncbi:MAG: hypothetical protein ACP5N1_01645 [Candidatus Woesearchaeota archaeon]
MTNKLNNKKGMTAQLGLLIIILISAIVIFMFITKFTSKSSFEQAITTCRMSVIAQYATEIAPSISGKKSPFDINCERRYIQFYNNRVELGLSLENMKQLPIRLEGKKVTRFNSLNEFVVNQVIAEELRICKFQFADGKIEVFGNNDAWSGQDICYVCSEINFDPKIGKKNFDTLIEYTKKTKYGSENITYYEYLTQETIYNNSMWVQPLFEEGILSTNVDTSKSYSYLIYIHKYDTGNIKDISKYAPNPHIQALRLIFPNLFRDTIDLGIVKAEDINKICDIQAN